MRFEWLALLALRRSGGSLDSAWVELSEVGRLPRWKGKPRHHISTYLGRYLAAPEITRIGLVQAKEKWAGPYRLQVDPLSIRFDVSKSEAGKRLQLTPARAAGTTNRRELLRFATAYVRAQWLFFQGRLKRQEAQHADGANAYGILMQMTEDNRYSSTLRLLARLSAVDVLFRLGAYPAARKSLLESAQLLRNTPNYALKARYHLALAWAYQRSSTGTHSDKAVEASLRKARLYAENGGDQAAAGQLAFRRAGYLTKKRQYQEAVDDYGAALESYLIVRDYNSVQATCADLGSSLHRVGPKEYDEVRRWILASIAIARLMHLGRDDAHGEMILGKIYVERGEKNRSRRLLSRAERIASRAGNRVNLGDIKMVWGFWFQRFGTREQLIETLVAAVNIFESMAEFDVPQKKRYMGHSFPEVWSDVLAQVAKGKRPRRPK